MRALIGQLDAMMGADLLKELPEIDNIKLFSEVLIYMGKSLADAVGVENLSPRSYIGQLTAITQNARRPHPPYCPGK